MQAMTFEKFRASGRDVADLEQAIPGMCLGDKATDSKAGRVYADGLYIEGTEDKWHMLIERDEWIGTDEDLVGLEEILWTFGLVYDPADDACGDLQLAGDELDAFVRGYCKLRHAEIDGDVFGIMFSGRDHCTVRDAEKICDDGIRIYSLDKRSQPGRTPS